MMECSVAGIGVLGPGLNDWEQARTILTGEAGWEVTPVGRIIAPGLPRAEARRATRASHLALTVAHQALGGDEPPDEAMPSVWAAADSDLVGLEKNCCTLAEDAPWISPHQFQNSVHNAPSGYWSITSGCRGPATSICAGDESFAAGLAEALTLLHAGSPECLLVAYDEASPTTLQPPRPVPHDFAVSLLLARGTDRGLPVRIEVLEPSANTGATPCEDPALDRLRCTNPAARSLPLLSALAAPARGGSIDLSWAGRSLRLGCGGGA